MTELEPMTLEAIATAPARLSTARVLRATPEAVFDAFEDATSWPRWVPVIASVVWTSELPPRVGSTRTVRMRGGITAEEQFLAYERGRRMAFTFERATIAGLRSFAEDYRVTDVGLGQVRVEWTMAIVADGPAAAGLGPFTRFGSAGLAWSLRRLERLINA